MASPAPTFRTPYTPTPGGSIPEAHVGPEEGKGDLWSFFWLTLANTAIIAVAGIAAWLYITH
jgi:hypothetical protein